jgi:hypothetical protein
MDIVQIDNQAYLRLAVENVTQPHLNVELRVLASYGTEDLERKRKLTHFMADQCKMLIPYFYELRNDMPRGRVKQLMSQRAKSLQDMDAVAAYRDILLADEFEFANDLPLQTITLQGRRLRVEFACAHDPEHIYFKREMSLPVDQPEFWAQVEAFEVARLADIELAKEKALRASNDESEDSIEDEPAYDMAI